MKRGKTETIDWILRIGLFGEFLGHGLFALQGKASFVGMITTILGLNQIAATKLLFVIGVMDVIVAILALVYPLRLMLVWAALWGFATGLARPLSGESVLDFIERWGNWALPLAFLLIKGIPTKLKEWFS